MGDIGRRGNKEEAAPSATKSAADGVGNEEVFFIHRCLVSDARRLASVRFDRAPLTHGNNTGPPVYRFIREGN